MTITHKSTVKDIHVPQRLLSLLREQASLYMQLEQLAEQQRTLISADDSGLLLSVLAQRRTLSARLGSIANGLEPVRYHWPEIRERLSSDLKIEAQNLWNQTRKSIDRLMKSDEQDVRLLSARKESIRRELRSTHSTTHAITAYKSKPDELSGMGRLDEAS